MIQTVARLILFTLIFSCGINLTAQVPSQTIRGVIKDLDSHQALPGATIELVGTEPLIGSTTNDQGLYRLENVPVGRYQIKVRFLGYESIVLSGVLVESGKELVQDVWLRESSETLDQIVVKANETQRIPGLSAHTITVEEIQRFAATFNDPVRLAMSYPGIVGNNDQANGVSIRGNSPSTVQWRLEGLEIVNPNHLSNAGTFFDRPSQSAGGVTILSAQMLGTSTIYKSAFPLEYGNAIGGIMDMSLRSGNNEQHEFTAQAGLIGFDFAAEGPFSKNSNASYLFNYRYSFTGLLTSFGVDFGDEQINYQDLSFNFNFPTKKGGNIKLFGLGGLSENIFERKPNEEQEEEKDAHDINFDAKMGAIGLKYEKYSRIGYLNLAALYSASENNYFKSPAMLFSFFPPDINKVDEKGITKKLSLAASINKKINGLNQLKYGLTATQIMSDFKTNVTYDFNILFITNFIDDQAKGENWLIRPYLNWIRQISPKLEFQIGLAAASYSQSRTVHVEPNLSLTAKLDEKQEVSFAASLHSQLHTPGLYFLSLDGGEGHQNSGLIPSQTFHIVAGYQRNLGPTTTFSAELYYQYLYEIPILRDSMASYSFLNFVDGPEWLALTLDNAGTGTNYGLDLSLQRLLNDSWYYLISASLYSSKFIAGDDQLYDTRFNGKYLLRFTGGKEFTIRKESKSKTKIFGLNLSSMYLGGMRRTENQFALFNPFEPNPFSEKLKDYFRTDLRFYWKWYKGNRTNTFALDIQNVTNTKNEAYFYYDQFLSDLVSKKQLGMIPNMSYKIEF